MKRLAWAAALLLAGPAMADMYQDASNAKLPGARVNLGLGPSVSIMDYGADPTGVASSEAAFASCIASGKDCRVPAGTYRLGCSAHNAAAGTAVVGDGATATVLKLSNACVVGPWSVLSAQEVRDLTIDMAGATTAAGGSIVVQLPRTAGPRVERVRVINAAPLRMYLVGLVSGGGATTDPIISHNYLSMASPTTSGTQCVLFSSSGGGTITGGSIDNNVCVNAGMYINATGLSIADNDVSGWNFGGGITTEAAAGSAKYLIAGNRFHDSGTALDVNNTAASGVENWGPDSVIGGNHCWNIGGPCVGNGGLRAVVSNNRAYGVSKGVANGSAFESGNLGSSYNASGTLYAGNWAGDDGSALPWYGYREQVNTFQNIVLLGNDFRGAPLGRIAPANLSVATAIDAASAVGGGASTVAALPSCGAALKHAVKPVSDQNGAPTYRGALTGGGSLAVLAYCNGTAWEAH